MKPGIIILGGGVIGSAVAMGLARIGARDVTVVDVDLEGSHSSSERNAGGVRATFHQPINIRASKLSIDYFATIASEIGFRECGYLWLCDEAQARVHAAETSLYAEEGWPVERWTPADIERRYPLLDRLDNVVAGYYGRRDGILNTNLLKMHYRRNAKAAGVRFVDRHFLRSAERIGEEWRLTFDVPPASLSEDVLARVLTRGEFPPGTERAELSAGTVVNCAGAWAGEVAKRFGTETAATPIRRQISLFDCRGGEYSDYGMIVDTSGVYFHPEATFFLSGIADKEEPVGKNFEYAGESFFQEKIWMPLSERSSRFENLKHLSGWAGLYEVSPDESAIVGEAGPGLFEAHSFSGHGVMHSYAVGMALAEKIIRGKYETFDFSPLAGDRFKTGQLLPETAVI